MYLDHFDQFKDMKPYLYINRDQWNYIKATFKKEDVQESLAKIAMDYPLPYQEISIADARKEYLALKGIRPLDFPLVDLMRLPPARTL